MAMLAGPRRKQKVINLRAKNNAWSNDASKFGQRMLEKMGWSSGKGLGAKENGIVEHVVARYKNDEKGLGFDDRNDQWTKHEDDFNALLANLSNANSDDEKMHSGVSLEVKSKKSKARIHYHKYTRGKDLSRYSEKELANIFGKKSLKDKEKEIAEELLEDVQKSEQIFTEKGSMADYFKNKLAKKLGKKFVVKQDDESETKYQGFGYQSEAMDGYRGFGFSMEVKDNDLGEETCYTGFGFQAETTEGPSDTQNLISNEESVMKKVKKQKKVKLVEENESSSKEKPNCVVSIEINDVHLEKKKKKKNKSKENENANNEVENYTNVKVNNESSGEKETQKKKKKSKRKNSELEIRELENVVEDNVEALNTFNEDTKERKRKKTKSEPLLSVDSEDNTPKKKKKKNR